RDALMEKTGWDRQSDEVKAWQEQYKLANPYPFATLDDVLDHIDHVVSLVGVEHVGLGSDFDGVGDSLPVGLKDVSEFPNLVAGLKARGYAETDIKKIMGENLMRVWSAVEGYAATSDNLEAP
ncbi:MAG: membrane dipeptidase, partial [Gammaproteobacteria bacterium]|nr:membrane dipeptidase [Gammaproteobacteria bacterium]